MSLILYTGLGTFATQVKNALDSLPDCLAQAYDDNGHTNGADVFIIGSPIAEPVKLVQKIVLSNKNISILILATNDRIAGIKQSFQFASNVGKNITFVVARQGINIGDIIATAALRAQQKRSFQQKSGSYTVPLIAAPVLKIDHLGKFLEQAPIGAILISRQQMEIVAMNIKGRMLLNIKEQLANLKLKEVFDQEHYSLLSAIIGNKANDSRSLYFNGKWLDFTVAEVADEEGRSFVMLFIEDVTVHKAEEDKIKAVLEAMPQMAWIAERSGIITYFTHRWYEYTGQDKASSMNEGWLNALHEDDAKVLAAKLTDCIHNRKTMQQAVRIRSSRAEFKWHLVRAVPVYQANSEVEIWTGTFTDIDDQILAAETLERKVQERTKLLEESNTELEQYARIASHDLQEPLRKIATFTNIFKNKYFAQLDDDGQKYINKINATALRMVATLRDLLTFTRVNKDGEGARPVNLNDVVTDVLEDLELLISQKRAVINLSTLPVVDGVPIQLKQLFYNLVNNALKFSLSTVTPQITISSTVLDGIGLSPYPELDREKSYYKITVQDNGIGFEQQYADQIFSIFKRLHTFAEYEGSGIGLALCKKIMLNHGGDIYALAELKRGAAFIMIFPVARPVLGKIA